MSFGRKCLKGGHIQLAYHLVGHVLCKDMFIDEHVLPEDTMTCFTGRHIIWEDMSHGETCLMGTHILWEYLSYRRTCLIGHVLGMNRSYKGNMSLMGGLVLWEDIS